MPSWTRLLRTIGAAAVAACVVLAGGSGRLALANGVGDLYVADPSAKAVLEVYLKTSSIEKPIDVQSAADALAFTPDGQTLYSSDGSTDLYQTRISDLSVTGPVKAAAPVTAIAHPMGSSLFLALQGSRQLSVLIDGSSTVIDGPTLPAVPTLLAADSREARFAAADAGGTWVSIVEPASGKVVEANQGKPLGGKVVAMAIARAEGYVWVATTGQDRVFLISLSTGAVVNSAPLNDGPPTAIAALGNYAVVASGARLDKVVAQSVTPWATAPGQVSGLAADLYAAFLYVATTDKVTALDVADPRATPQASVTMPGGTKPGALAPVPNKGSSLTSTGGTAPSAGTTPSATPSPSGRAAAATPGMPTPTPRRTHAPATDTVPAARASGPGADLGSLLLGVGAVVVAVVVGSRYLIRRLIGE